MRHGRSDKSGGNNLVNVKKFMLINYFIIQKNIMNFYFIIFYLFVLFLHGISRNLVDIPDMYDNHLENHASRTKEMSSNTNSSCGYLLLLMDVPLN